MHTFLISIHESNVTVFLDMNMKTVLKFIFIFKHYLFFSCNLSYTLLLYQPCLSIFQWASQFASRVAKSNLPLSGMWMLWYCKGVIALSGSPNIFMKSTLKMSSSRSIICGGAGGRGGAVMGKGTNAQHLYI